MMPLTHRRFGHQACTSGALTSWFPGHMLSSLRSMQNEDLQSAHLIVEVRDARLPLTSASTQLQPLIANKHRLIVLNKSDLADLPHRKRLADAVRQQCRNSPDVVFASRHSHHSLLSAIVEAAATRSRFRTIPRLVMIVGVPNVGKSSIIRALKYDKKSAKVGAEPGITRAISRIRLDRGRTGPDLYLVDTPGILPPAIPSELEALKLSLVHSIPEHVMGNFRTGQYLHRIVTGVDAADDEYYRFLGDLARHRSFYLSSTNELDLDRAMRLHLERFRDGKLGRFMLDEI